MFKLLKEKLKGWLKKSSKYKEIRVKKEPEKEKVEGAQAIIEEVDKLPKADIPPEKQEIIEKLAPEQPKEKKSIFTKVKEKFTKTTIYEDHFDKIFSELEEILLENNVAYEVMEKRFWESFWDEII